MASGPGKRLKPGKAEPDKDICISVPEEGDSSHKVLGGGGSRNFLLGKLKPDFHSRISLVAKEIFAQDPSERLYITFIGVNDHQINFRCKNLQLDLFS